MKKFLSFSLLLVLGVALGRMFNGAPSWAGEHGEPRYPTCWRVLAMT